MTVTRPTTSTPMPAEEAARTKILLACGVVAGPVFLVVSLLQVLTREGFDITRHALSFLSIGDWGWIQITNFIVTGLLFVTCAMGMRRTLQDGRARTWGPLLIAALGVGLIAGGVFVADPAFGFPPGTPNAMPEDLTTHGMLHGVAGGVGFLSLIASCFVFARRFEANGERSWTIASVVVGTIFLVAAIGSGASPGKAAVNIGLSVALALAFVWSSAVSAKLRGGAASGAPGASSAHQPARTAAGASYGEPAPKDSEVPNRV